MFHYLRMTSRQKDQLITLVESDEVLNSKVKGRPRKEMAEAWNRVAERMNLMEGAQRDGPGWQKSYSDIIANARKKEKRERDPDGDGEDGENEEELPEQEHSADFRRKNADSEAIKLVLMECLKKRPYLIHADRTSPEQNKKGWEEVASVMVNSLNDCRTATQWKLYWRNCKCSVKRLVMRREWESSRPGGVQITFSEIEEDMLRLIGKEKETWEISENDYYSTDPFDSSYAMSDPIENDCIEEEEKEEETRSRKVNRGIKNPNHSSLERVVQETQKLKQQLERRPDNGAVVRELKRIRIAMTKQHIAMMHEMKNLTNAVLSVSDALERATEAFASSSPPT